MAKIHIFGIGFKYLSAKERELLKKIPKILIFHSHIKILQEDPTLYDEIKEKLSPIKNLNQLWDIVNDKNLKEDIALFATGDPLFFGIADTLLKHIPKEELLIYPDLSTLQVLCARLKIPFHKVKTLSFHGRPLSEEILIANVITHPYLFLFTDSSNTPSFIAKLLYEKGLNQLKFHVGEGLGTLSEQIYSGEIKEFLELSFKEPNSLLIENPYWGEDPLLGITEEEISHLKGMITKDEVRAIVIHKLKPPKRGILWDIGAGSGSISLEIAKLSPDLRVFAIEKDLKQHQLIEENKRKFNLFNLETVMGEAPEVLSSLPLPNRVFIGGSGNKLESILQYLLNLKSLEIIVATFVSLENLQLATNLLEGIFNLHISQVQINRLSTLNSYKYLRAQNPIFVFQAIKK